MRFITDLMIISQNSDYPFTTFVEYLNEMKLSPSIMESAKKFMFNADLSSQAVVNWFEGSDTEQSDDAMYATEILYRQLAELFDRFSDIASIKQIPAANRDKCFEFTCKSLETLLKCSGRARILAAQQNFALLIIEQMQDVYSSIDGSFTEFVRKNGNSKVF